MADVLNIAATLTATAARFPDQTAVVVPQSRDRSGCVTYADLSFRQLDVLSDRLAAGLKRMGISPLARIVLMVRPGIEFMALTYALFKCGAVVVLIDPGMGTSRVFRCLDQVDPQGFVAIPAVHAVRAMSFGRFPNARFNVTVGRRWFWGGKTYHEIFEGEGPGEDSPDKLASMAPTVATDAAAIIFTSGSTGPAKGVVYEHGMFAAQVEALRDGYNIEPGGVDLPGFPLFALFNAAMGVTTVIPEMDPTRPAQVNPARIVEAIENRQVTQGFGSPAIWNRVGRYCEQHRIRFPKLRRVFSAGAPVPVDVLRRMRATLPSDGEMYTPYGATEALPVCSISATEVLARTAQQTARGAGTCVGKPFPQVRVKIIAITDGPIALLGAARELPAGQIGEIIVSGPIVTREYYRRPEATAAAKIPDGDRFWHRMGDVGYLDAEGALWFCGRKSHVVETADGPMFTECVEPIFNTHPAIGRCALVGVGQKPHQTPVIVLELEPRNAYISPDDLRRLASAHPTTHRIGSQQFLVYYKSLPVDVRHNIKINREKLAVWAAREY
ncbi:MAG: peptide synthase [Planctomycetaceae bacterium]|nr:peptide synthase [Planctomycetaceae bacterium]